MPGRSRTSLDAPQKLSKRRSAQHRHLAAECGEFGCRRQRRVCCAQRAEFRVACPVGIAINVVANHHEHLGTAGGNGVQDALLAVLLQAASEREAGDRCIRGERPAGRCLGQVDLAGKLVVIAVE
jgi:hypothetical protein